MSRLSFEFNFRNRRYTAPTKTGSNIGANLCVERHSLQETIRFSVLIIRSIAFYRLRAWISRAAECMRLLDTLSTDMKRYSRIVSRVIEMALESSRFLDMNEGLFQELVRPACSPGVICWCFSHWHVPPFFEDSASWIVSWILDYRGLVSDEESNRRDSLGETIDNQIFTCCFELHCRRFDHTNQWFSNLSPLWKFLTEWVTSLFVRVILIDVRSIRTGISEKFCEYLLMSLILLVGYFINNIEILQYKWVCYLQTYDL